MKHVLVTGGAGYIGSHACKLLAQQGYVPVTFDSLVAGSFAVLLADDFLTYDGAGVTADLVKGYEVSGRTQLSVMEVTLCNPGSRNYRYEGARQGTLLGPGVSVRPE